MHIGFICDQYPPHPVGGVGARISDLADGLKAAGHKVTVVGILARSRGARSEIDEIVAGVRVIRMLPPPQWLRWRPGQLVARFALSRRLRAIHREDPLDLVECTEGFGPMVFGAPRGVPLLVRMEGTVTGYDAQMGVPQDRFLRRLEQSNLRRADCFAAVSQSALSDTRAYFEVPDRPTRVIFNAVDTDLFQPDAAVPAERGLIVFVNAVEARKGVRELVAAMDHVAPRHAEARLAVVGSDPGSGGERFSERVLREVRPKFADRIQFLGRMDRQTGVLEMLRKAHVCIYPSQAETFGIAPLEAMAVGKPVVYTKFGPGGELIEDGVSGLLCDPKSPTDIAEKINRVLGDDALAGALGKAARKRAVSLFGKREWIAKNIAFFSECIASRRGNRGV